MVSKAPDQRRILRSGRRFVQVQLALRHLGPIFVVVPESVATVRDGCLGLWATGCSALLTPGSSLSVVQVRQNEAHLPPERGVCRFDRFSKQPRQRRLDVQCFASAAGHLSPRCTYA
jgi:hypothetical protein